VLRTQHGRPSRVGCALLMTFDGTCERGGEGGEGVQRAPQEIEERSAGSSSQFAQQPQEARAFRHGDQAAHKPPWRARGEPHANCASASETAPECPSLPQLAAPSPSSLVRRLAPRPSVPHLPRAAKIFIIAYDVSQLKEQKRAARAPPPPPPPPPSRPPPPARY
jgi:hypothetical protein